MFGCSRTSRSHSSNPICGIRRFIEPFKGSGGSSAGVDQRPHRRRPRDAGSTGYGGWCAMTIHQPLRVGIGGPVGSGKTALTLALCRELRGKYQLAVVTNDIYTEEDAQFLVRNEALPPERIIGVETGGCPHTAIREDASINLEAVERLIKRFPKLD